MRLGDFRKHLRAVPEPKQPAIVRVAADERLKAAPLTDLEFRVLAFIDRLQFGAVTAGSEPETKSLMEEAAERLFNYGLIDKANWRDKEEWHMNANGRRRLQERGLIPCQACQGTGRSDTPSGKCPSCDGTRVER